MLRESLASFLKVNCQEILLSYDGKLLPEESSLLNVGAVPFKSLQLTITAPRLTDENLLLVQKNYVPMVDIITVKFTDDLGQEIERTVEIENQCLSKPWLGGFKHTLKKKDYHHAQTQTKCLKKLKQEYAEQTGTPLLQTYSQQTQTPSFPLRNTGVQTVTSTGVQTYQNGIYITNPYDKLITPKTYQTYEEWVNQNKVVEKVIKIQRWVRRHEVRQKIVWLMRVYKLIDQEERETTQQIKIEQLEEDKVEISDSARSKRRYNYQIIVSMINEWWKKEKQRITESKTEAPRKAEMYQLLKKEINLLTALQKKQSEMQRENIGITDLMILDRVAEPVKFKSRTGQIIYIDSLETQRAREFIHLYKKLVHKKLTVRDRIEVLLKAKAATTNSDEYKFSEQLQRLIERELSLLRMGATFSEISELQRRIHQLFLDFIKRPECNPAIVSSGLDQFNNDMLFTCKRCSKSLPLYEFSADSRKNKLDICNKCLRIENVATTRIDFTPYERMLKLIRDDEIRRRCYSSTCFILQPYGIYFIVNVIWYGESALSESDYLPDLRLVRWEVNKVWSPWNCILLTREEAPVHLRISDIHKVYNPNFIQKIRLKHYTTKCNFKMLLKSDVKINNNSLWQSIKDSGELINSSAMNRFIEKSNSVDTTVANFESMIQSYSLQEE
ncbi:IQ motif and ubiquitin-like domain-containing protein [Bemisia tabaci]|nr:PREDICTED: IQ and ubiquitin-like domain-containing protein [Bemisia tabaci]